MQHTPTTSAGLQRSARLRADGVAAALVRVPAWVALSGIVAVSTGLRFLAAREVSAPWIAPDEMLYGSLAQNLYRAGQLTVLDGPTPFYSLVYPALAGTVLSWADLERGYAVLKILQAFVMSLAAVPVYLWGRTLMARHWALLAAALAVAIPGLAYSGLVMSEVAFYPVLILAFWALANALVRPTLLNQGLLAVAVLAAGLTRLQGVVLLPVLLTAVVLYALFERRLTTALALWPTFLGLGAVAIAWVVWRLARGGPWNQILGGYAAAGSAKYSFGEALKYIGYHLGDLFLMTGLIPACALALLAWEAAFGRETGRGARAFLAVAIAGPLWLVVQVGTFASRHVYQLAERNLLPAAPLLFLALALWVDRGAVRPRLLTSLIAILASIPILILPVETFINAGALPDAFTLIPFYRLLQEDPGVNLGVVIFGGATAVAALFVLLPRRLVAALPAALLLALAGASYAAGQHVAQQAAVQRTEFLGPVRRWIDSADGGKPAAYLYQGDPSWNLVWAQVFWNRSLRSILDLPGTRVTGPLPQSRVRVWGSGRVTLADGQPVRERYVVAPVSYQLAGRRVWKIATRGTDMAGLTLWRLRGPLRIRTAKSGIAPDGTVRGRARLVAYGCTGGSFRLLFGATRPLGFEVHENGVPLKLRPTPPLGFVHLRPRHTWSRTIPARPVGAPGQSMCTLDVPSGDGLYFGRFQYVPARSR